VSHGAEGEELFPAHESANEADTLSEHVAANPGSNHQTACVCECHLPARYPRQNARKDVQTIAVSR